jgi:DNA-binding NtrC family response regulator
LTSILVVDDDFAMRRAIALLLQGHNFQVFEAVDADQALQLVETHSPDLAILDLFLPGRDGIQLAIEIQKVSPATKMLLLTAHGEHEKAAQARKIFAQNFLEKKSLDNILFPKINEILFGNPQ